MSAFSLESVASDDGELKWILFIFLFLNLKKSESPCQIFIGMLLGICWKFPSILLFLVFWNSYLQYFPRNIWHEVEHFFL